jgi:diguanylate cyclase (GGDEF)-like protein
MRTTLPGYRILETISEGWKTVVYRGQRIIDRQPVVIKLLKSNSPTIGEMLQWRNQYLITKNLDLIGTVKSYSLEQYDLGMALVMEDFGGISLLDYLATQKCEELATQHLEDFLRIALALAQILEQLYQKQIIHQDIKPHNILINPTTKQVKLTNFRIASLLPRENNLQQNINLVTDTLAYMSPEQTGRMNRGIDYRTDFYSLGVTFYQLLTGKLPFSSRDPLELVHCHLARKPRLPTKVNLAVPSLVSEIVLKLMAKTPEERYQTAKGLRYDLERCWEQWQKSKKIIFFPLGTRDRSDRFAVPEKLYGRKQELEALLNAFARVSQGQTEIMLVAGFSGIGKTALINEVHKPIVRQRGYFIGGKFDQFQRNIPFSAISQAFGNIIEQLLTESSIRLQDWKKKLLAALDDNGQIIIEVIPQLETIIGQQPPVPELEPTAAQNRFNLVFEQFIRVFATKDHPLVIFLDDLQWADSNSLKLIQRLIETNDLNYLLLIGAYRNNEVNQAHPLMITIEELLQTLGKRLNQISKINQINLPPLSQVALNSLIADTLVCDANLALPLNKLVWQKTKGNPFFTIQFLQSLHQEGLISFDLSGGCWQCDLSRIKILSVSDDVVKFMASRLQKLPVNTQKVLRLAACLGNQFELKTLAIAYKHSLVETARDLWQALQEGLVLPLNEIYKFFLNGEIAEEIPQTVNKPVAYKFVHDRVQQAAYSLLPSKEKAATHLDIGRLLWQHLPPAAISENIFTLVNHLNWGLNLIEEKSEREQVAELNLIAGCKAKDATAYTAAFDYFSTGLKLLAADCWQKQYELTLDLYVGAASTAYLCGNFDSMTRLITQVLQHGRSLLDKVRVYEVKIQGYLAQGKPLAAVETALEVSRYLGFKFPLKPRKLKIGLALVKTKLVLLGKKIEDLIELPAMEDPFKLAAGRIMLSATSSIYSAAPEIVPLLALKAVSLSVRCGNAALSIDGYAGYGVILCGALGEIDAGYRFGKLALNLLAKLQAKELKARTYVIFNNFIRHWQEPVRAGLKPLLEAYQTGLVTGDLEFAAYAVYMHCYHSYLVGSKLTDLEDKMAIYSEAIACCGQANVLRIHQLYQQVVSNLLGKTNNPWILKGDNYNEEIILPQLQAANHISAIFDLYCHKSILCYLFSQYRQAQKYAAFVEKHLDTAIGTLLVPLFHFYDSLIKLTLYDYESKKEKKCFLNQVNKNQKKLKKWAKYAPMNYLHKFYLVEAEKERVLGRYLHAITNYDRAIKLAGENQYVNEEALAQELASKFYLAWNQEKIAQIYLTDAYNSYARWGALAKLKDLAQRYPESLATVVNPINNQFSSQQKFSGNQDNLLVQQTEILKNLDLATVIKASQAISKEIHLEQLLSTLIAVIIENAGAEIGYLLLLSRQQIEDLIVEAKVKDNSITVNNLSSTSIQSSEKFSSSIINYVKTTRRPLVLAAATAETTFALDPYIIKQQPKSVLCAPILKQNELIGLIYLENNLTEGAFTRDRLEIINLLCAQAAISLDNARLYHNLEESEARAREKTQKLEKYLQTLQKTQKELLKIQRQLKHDAFHDSLTGLPNRICFSKLLEKAINLAARYPHYLYAVLFLDLDRFKIVNDSLGHLIGDELLKHVAQKLQACMRSSDTVARFGGDEFVILLEEIKNIQEVIIVAERILAQLKQPFIFNNYQITTGSSIGITLSTFNYQNSEDVLRDADAAMYQAKAKGKGCYVVFEPGMQTRVMAGLQLENDLRSAIAREEFILYYQPIVSLATGNLNGFEALLRWYHPTKGWISPIEFIPIAEETGLINQIGLWVLESACHQLWLWLKEFPQARSLTINVNLSTIQLQQVDLLKQLKQIWQEYQLPNSAIKLEITESCILETFTSEAQRLKQLKDLGISLCIDDFGTGYSSLSRLHEFPIDTLKIDRSFVSRLESNIQHQETVRTIVTLAHSLGMDVVAEGVETNAQLEQLQQLNCEYVQGYLFSKPVDSKRATQLIAKNKLLPIVDV